MREASNTIMYRAKIYNKLVCEFDSVSVRGKVGTHHADYLEQPAERLAKTFAHEAGRAHGITQLEFTIYSHKWQDLDQITCRLSSFVDMFLCKPDLMYSVSAQLGPC